MIDYAKLRAAAEIGPRLASRTTAKNFPLYTNERNRMSRMTEVAARELLEEFAAKIRSNAGKVQRDAVMGQDFQATARVVEREERELMRALVREICS